MTDGRPTTDDRLAAILRNQMALMMGLAELLMGDRDAKTAQRLCIRHELTRHLIETLEP